MSALRKEMALAASEISTTGLALAGGMPPYGPGRALALHPGYVMRRLFQDQGATLADISRASGIAEQTLEALCAAQTDLTPFLAKKLSPVMELSTGFFSNLQSHYNTHKKNGEIRLSTI